MAVDAKYPKLPDGIKIEPNNYQPLLRGDVIEIYFPILNKHNIIIRTRDDDITLDVSGFNGIFWFDQKAEVNPSNMNVMDLKLDSIDMIKDNRIFINFPFGKHKFDHNYQVRLWIRDRNTLFPYTFYIRGTSNDRKTVITMMISRERNVFSPVSQIIEDSSPKIKSKVLSRNKSIEKSRSSGSGIQALLSPRSARRKKRSSMIY
jgi:hypothetical protein